MDGEVMDGMGDKKRRITCIRGRDVKVGVIIERANERQTRNGCGYVGNKINWSTTSQERCEAAQNELTAGRTPSQGLM